MFKSPVFIAFYASAILYIVGEAIMSFFPLPDNAIVHHSAEIVRDFGVVGFIGTFLAFILSLKKD